ncbi:hypothetical protein [Capnocytophaga leadbetteri]|uniref:hypothetical protein n=1 Tax=Capnocytophaga leadbetteri TaxID=327575 RepID=UPI0028EDA5E2|nr:hypothetical protein [Capnocytophaga leadbetteri]
MPYTITIPHDTPQALAYVEKAKKLDFVKVTEIKEFEEETQEQYEVIMALSKKTNRAIARKLDKAKNLNLPFKN